jgi:tetratricopeptide (TPR) repeat protein
MRLLADALIHKGRGHQQRREFKPALEVYQRSLDIRLSNFGGVESPQSEQLSALTECYRAIGRIHHLRGAPLEEQAAAETTIAMADKWAAADPENIEALEARTRALMVLADLDRQFRRNNEALVKAANGIKTADDVLASHGTSLAWLRLKASFLLVRGDVFRNQKRWAEALDSYGATLTMRRRMSDADPQNVTILSEVAYSLIKLGETYLASDDPKGAVDYSEEAVKIYDRILTLSPENQAIARQFIDALHNIAKIHKRSGDKVALRATNNRQLALAERFMVIDADNRDSKRMLSEALIALGETDMLEDQAANALVRFQKAEAILRLLTEVSDIGKREHADVLDRIGSAKLKLKDIPGALVSLSESQTLRTELLAAREGETMRRVLLAETWQLIGSAHRAGGACVEGLAAYTMSRDLLARVVTDAPTEPRWPRYLAAVRGDLAEMEQRCRPMSASSASALQSPQP